MFRVRRHADSACQDVEIVGSRECITTARFEFASIDVSFVNFKFKTLICWMFFNL